MVGGARALDGVAVVVCLAGEILTARAGADLVHGARPEVVVGSPRCRPPVVCSLRQHHRDVMGLVQIVG